MKNRTYSHEIAAIIQKTLDGDDWHYSFNKNRGTFRFDLSISNKIQRIKYLVIVGDDDVAFYGICPINACPDDPKMMAQMAEFVCRANYGLQNGSFELDFRDGEIRYKSYVDCEGVLPSADMVRNSIGVVAVNFKVYGPGILDVIFCDRPAKESITKCEDSLEELEAEAEEEDSQAEQTPKPEDLTAMIERLSMVLGAAGAAGPEADSETAAQDAEEIHMDPFAKKNEEDA